MSRLIEIVIISIWDVTNNKLWETSHFFPNVTLQWWFSNWHWYLCKWDTC